MGLCFAPGLSIHGQDKRPSQTDVHPGGIKIEKSGPRIFVTLTGVSKLGVVDRKKREQITAWPVTGVEGNVALAFDESHHRLFDGTRNHRC
jgi:hypothetical protein